MRRLQKPDMLRKARYIENPCRASSLPYWKTLRTVVPENMRIVHEDDFSDEYLKQYTDARYFRLKHDLQNLCPAILPEGFVLYDAKPADYAGHINSCYGSEGMTEAEMKGYAAHDVYDPKLWIAVLDCRTGEIAATGIAELDKDLGEGVLEWIQVSERCRGQGLGTYVVSELLWRLRGKARFVTVSGQVNNATNPEALYRKCGFTGSDVWHILRKR